MINYGRQSITRQDIECVIGVLESDFLTQGPQVNAFEAELSSATQSKYSTAVNSATAALHLALLSLGVEPGDRVWVPAISFVATANTVLMCGAEIEFLDVYPDTGNIDVQKLEEKLSSTPGPAKPKVIVAVHMAGTPCDMSVIKRLADKYDIKVLEDASHALGAEYSSKKVGSCEFSDVSVFSFHPVKMITTGEGGALTTNDADLSRLSKIYRSHGIDRDRVWGDKKNWEYDQTSIGYNYRMPDFNAALGRSQLKKLDAFVSKRNNIASTYNKFFEKLNVKTQHIDEECKSSFHLYVIFLDCADERQELYETFKQYDINTQIHYRPIYQNSFYRNNGFSDVSLPGAEMYYSRCLSLPIFYDMEDAQINYVQTVFYDWLRSIRK